MSLIRFPYSKFGVGFGYKVVMGLWFVSCMVRGDSILFHKILLRFLADISTTDVVYYTCSGHLRQF